MKASIAVTRATRRIHSFAVRLHCAALYQRVVAAEAATDKAEEGERHAEAIYNSAKRASQEASKAHQRARHDEFIVVTAAEAEAHQIGGKL